MSKQLKLIRNTLDEEAAIQRGIDSDPDTFVPSDEKFAQMKRRGDLALRTKEADKQTSDSPNDEQR